MEQRLPPAEWDNRRERLQRLLRLEGMAGCLVTQNVSIYYFTGSMQTGYVYIPAEGEAAYYVRRSIDRALRESKIRTEELGTFRKFGERLAADYPASLGADGGSAGIPLVGTDLDVMPALLYFKLSEVIPNAKLVDASALIRETRSVKSAHEVGKIERSADIAAEGLERGIASLREGMTELELMSVIEQSMRLGGHSGIMRLRGYNQEVLTGMVAAGEAAAEPTYFDGPAGGVGLSPASPQSVSFRPIGRNEPILIDIGCNVDGYVIDQTRTAVIGKLEPALQSAYETSVAIMRRSETLLRPGARPEDVYGEALRMADEAGLSAHFMGFGRDQVKFLGHGIGLEIDEWPVLARGFGDPLEPGMVIAVEPKFAFPGQGVVGLENTYLITEDGCRALTRSPEKLFEL